jgi:hypothetical protein
MSLPSVVVDARCMRAAQMARALGALIRPLPHNKSLQRTVIDKLFVRGPAVLAPRPRNHARLAPRTAAELNR